MIWRKFFQVLFISTLVIITFSYCKSDNSNEHVNSSDIAANTGSGNDTRAENNDIISNKRRTIITDIVEKASPAIVGINVTEVVQVQYRDPFDIFSDDPFFRRYYGNRRQKRYREYEVQGLGSGFLISEDGYIITNHHVAGNASKIIVTTTDGKKHDAEIIGADKTTDVALLKIEGEDFPHLKFCQSDDILIGEWVIAFGNPFGLFELNASPTVTVGVVSNMGIDFYQENRIYKNMIQTDAAISSGNSGGPLLNAAGEVIGVNTIIFSTAQNQRGAGSIGIGWAIPINRIKKIVEVLKEDGKVNRNYSLGIEVREMDKQLAQYLGIDLVEGIVVIAVERNSLSDNAGLDPGDIILSVNGNKTVNNEDFYINAYDSFVGDTLEFEIIRNEEIKKIKLELKEIK